MNVRIEPGQTRDRDEMLALFPRLASFNVPDGRNPKHLWGGDAKMLEDWAENGNDDCLVHVAKDESDNIVGMTMVTLGPELLSHTPSAHLEVIVVAESAEGHGAAKLLLDAAESSAQKRGAQSMSLHVFANNLRARKVYEREGYDGELMRYIKPFKSDALK